MGLKGLIKRSLNKATDIATSKAEQVASRAVGAVRTPMSEAFGVGQTAAQVASRVPLAARVFEQEFRRSAREQGSYGEFLHQLNQNLNPFHDTDITGARKYLFGSDRDLRLSDLSRPGFYKRLPGAAKIAFQNTQIYPGAPTYGQLSESVREAAKHPTSLQAQTEAALNVAAVLPVAGATARAAGATRASAVAARATQAAMVAGAAGSSARAAQNPTPGTIFSAGLATAYAAPELRGIGRRTAAGFREATAGEVRGVPAGEFGGVRRKPQPEPQPEIGVEAKTTQPARPTKPKPRPKPPTGQEGVPSPRDELRGAADLESALRAPISERRKATIAARADAEQLGLQRLRLAEATSKVPNNEFVFHRGESGEILVNNQPYSLLVSGRRQLPGFNPMSEESIMAAGMMRRGAQMIGVGKTTSQPPINIKTTTEPQIGPREHRGRGVVHSLGGIPTGESRPLTVARAGTPADLEGLGVEELRTSSAEAARRPGPVITRKLTPEEIAMRASGWKPPVEYIPTAPSVQPSAPEVAPPPATASRKPRATQPKPPRTPAEVAQQAIEAATVTASEQPATSAAQPKTKPKAAASPKAEAKKPTSAPSGIGVEAKPQAAAPPKAEAKKPTPAVAPKPEATPRVTIKKPTPPPPGTGAEAKKPAPPPPGTGAEAKKPTPPPPGTGAEAKPKEAPAKTEVQEAPASEPTKVRLNRQNGTTATSPGQARRIIARAAELAQLKPFPKKTAIGLGAATTAGVALSQRGPAQPPSLEAQTEEAFLQTVPADIREDVRALLKVRKEKGEAGLRALVEGRDEVDRYPEFGGTPTPAGTPTPGSKPVAAPLGGTREDLTTKRNRLLREAVARAYARIKASK